MDSKLQKSFDRAHAESTVKLKRFQNVEFWDVYQSGGSRKKLGQIALPHNAPSDYILEEMRRNGYQVPALTSFNYKINERSHSVQLSIWDEPHRKYRNLFLLKLPV